MIASRRPSFRLVVAGIVVLVSLAQSGRSQGVLAQTASTEAVPAPTVLVPTGADWKYLDDGSNQAVDWRAPGFDDGSWAEGPAQLGYGDADEATLVGYGSDDQSKFSTTYFRHAFTVDSASAHTNFLVRLVRDDGAVVYLNGVEIFRSNMAEGAVLYDDFSTAPVSGDDETASVSGFFTENYLADGLNVLAVEIHQADGPSSDLSFDLELLAGFEPGPPVIAITDPADGESLIEGNIDVTVDTQFEGGVVTSVEFFAGDTLIGESFTAPFTFPWRQVAVGDYTLTAHVQTSLGVDATSAPVNISVTSVPESAIIRLGDSWRYLDDGSDQGTAWRDAALDDAGWPEGEAQLGYGFSDEATEVGFGPDAENKYVTTYFRKTFTVDDPADYASLTGALTYDDGAIVYLNGSEVFRIKMPGGVVSFDTEAFDAADYAPEPLSLNLNQLLPGTNVVAVEIHQAGGASSDLIFDLMLEGE